MTLGADVLTACVAQSLQEHQRACELEVRGVGVLSRANVKQQAEPSAGNHGYDLGESASGGEGRTDAPMTLTLDILGGNPC